MKKLKGIHKHIMPIILCYLEYYRKKNKYVVLIISGKGVDFPKTLLYCNDRLNQSKFDRYDELMLRDR